jgi:hypothetical protein
MIEAMASGSPAISLISVTSPEDRGQNDIGPLPGRDVERMASQPQRCDRVPVEDCRARHQRLSGRST